MRSQPSATESRATRNDDDGSRLLPSVDSEITWLLHRAAQHMRALTDEQAEQHGIRLRDYIVLSAIDLYPDRTQIELGKSLGLDKTTLMVQLDRLERMGLVVRHNDPRDRRRRIPKCTESGRAVRARVATAGASVEGAALGGFSEEQVDLFRRMLVAIIGDSEDSGSCL
ncbi:MarR family winged helix-turn-helix transcriptional regulator [Actinophytocola sp.]|uniref:MarR family winged helix-turn-helix transcriptional regulator n=1 Tax=Actinophytocola sp. TaxID=1872138 RepID=UPI003899B005